MSKFKRITAVILALVLIISVTVVGSFAGQKVEPLFTITDVSTRQGEEFDVTIKFAQDINPSTINIAALDVSLKYNSSVYTVVAMTEGAGLTYAFDKLQKGTSLHLEHGYVFDSGFKEPGEAKWSLSTLEGFTFQKGTAFAVVTLKANDVSSLEGNINLTVEVTNAMTKSFENTTYMYPSATNTVKLDVNLAKLCNWEYDYSSGTYRLAKFNDANATKFTIPDTYGESIVNIKPVSKIKYGAFSYCTKMESVVIGKNVDTIDSGAFFNCGSLKKVTIYSDDITIGSKAFIGSDSNLTIKCRKGSAAEEYAKANNIKVEYFGNIADLKYTGLDEVKYYNDGMPAEFKNLKFYDEDGTALVEGKNYKVEYENNVNVGTGVIHVTGLGEYVGSRDITFEIKCPFHVEGSKYYTEVQMYGNCAEGGKLIKDCTFCKYHDESATLPAKTHVKDKEVVVKEATCAEAGKKAWTCKNCNAYLDETLIIPVNHENDWVVTIPATCEHEGVASFECKVCHTKTGATKTLPKEQHLVQWIITAEPTCMKNGQETEMCPYCQKTDGETKVRTIEARGYHVAAEEWVTITPATCTAEGVEVRYCKDCGETVSERPIAKKAHTASTQTVTVEPTCTEPGYEKIVCADCGADLGSQVTRAAYGHSLSAYGVIKEATCTEKGKVGQVCARCKGEFNVSETEALGHLYSSSSIVIKKATCVVDGLEGVQCSRCGDIKENTSKTIKARGYHSYGPETVAVEATCMTEGFKQCTCSACEDVKIEIIKAGGHKESTVPQILPTYRSTGVDKVVCEYCDYDFGRTVIVPKIVPDLDGDRKVSSIDALMILQHATRIKTLSGTPLKNADCNGDASVNSTDALIVLQLSAGLISDK